MNQSSPKYNDRFGIFTITDRPTDSDNRSLMPVILSWFYTIMSSKGGISIKSELR